jgi:hypothetical protein
MCDPGPVSCTNVLKAEGYINENGERSLGLEKATFKILRKDKEKSLFSFNSHPATDAGTCYMTIHVRTKEMLF